MFGKADPYARVTLGGQVSRSHTVNNNQVSTVTTYLPIHHQSPEWSWETVLEVDGASPRTILIEVGG